MWHPVRRRRRHQQLAQRPTGEPAKHRRGSQSGAPCCHRGVFCDIPNWRRKLARAAQLHQQHTNSAQCIQLAPISATHVLGCHKEWRAVRLQPQQQPFAQGHGACALQRIRPQSALGLGRSFVWQAHQTEVCTEQLAVHECCALTCGPLLRCRARGVQRQLRDTVGVQPFHQSIGRGRCEQRWSQW